VECNKLGLGKGLLKVRAKVTGFLIAKIEKRNTPEQVIISKKRNTILTTGLQNLLNAFQTYMSGVNYLGVNAPSSGILLTTSSGQQVTLLFLTPPAISLESNSIILSFTVRDDTTSSYTATSEELITRSAGYNIPIATANLSITKNSDEILTMTWIITISVSPSGNIQYLPTVNAQVDGCSYSGYPGSCGCPQLPSYVISCSANGLLTQYPQTNLITSQLFIDMFYNTYGKGPSNSLTSYVNTTLYIYTYYCMEYFIVGLAYGQPAFLSYYGGSACFITNTYISETYLQVYSPSGTGQYIGVQIEFTT